MQVGAFFQFSGYGREDREVWAAELALADLVEPLGFHSLWSLEHHFGRYAVNPDPLQFLSYMAGRTDHVSLGSGVIVLPWHDPVRVAEQILVLDQMSGGRALIGLGRGTGKIEYDGFRRDMASSRGFYREAAQAMLTALETGVMEYDGEYFTQPRVELHPSPYESFRGRVYSASLSPESAQIMARLGTGVFMIPLKTMEQHQTDIANYRATYQEVIGLEPPPPIVVQMVYVDSDAERAAAVSRQAVTECMLATIEHYEFDKPHLGSTPGYEFHGRLYEQLNQPNGKQEFVDFNYTLTSCGTPDKVLENIQQICQMMGANHFVAQLRFGGMDPADAESSMRLFAKEVLPVLKTWQPVAAASVAA